MSEPLSKSAVINKVLRRANRGLEKKSFSELAALRKQLREVLLCCRTEDESTVSKVAKLFERIDQLQQKQCEEKV